MFNSRLLHNIATPFNEPFNLYYPQLSFIQNGTAPLNIK
jgi:hypothetical protein